MVIRETFLEDFLKQARPCWVLKGEKEGREDHSGQLPEAKAPRKLFFMQGSPLTIQREKPQ